MGRVKKIAPTPLVAGPDQYFLHVQDDGQELQFSHKPEELPCTLVEMLDGGVEQVRMRLADGKSEGAERRLICPRPHGRGWELFDSSSDKVAVWRRSTT